VISNFANKHVVMLNSALLTHGQTATAIVDTREFEDVTVVVSGALAGAGTNPAVSFLTADTTNTADVVTAVATQSLPTGAGECLVYQMPKLGKRRYVRLTVTAPSGSTNSNLAPIHAVAILGRKDEGGVSTADIANSTNSVVVFVP
jgi:hypothetical protein